MAATSAAPLRARPNSCAGEHRDGGYRGEPGRGQAEQTAEQAQPQQVRRGAGGDAPGGPGREVLLRMRDRSLQTRSGQDDAGHQDEDAEGVGVERFAGLALLRHRGERLRSRLVVAVEVEPPEGGGQGQPEQRRDDRDRLVQPSLGADSEVHYRFAQGDDHDQPVALGEVRRSELEAGLRTAQGGGNEDAEGRTPEDEIGWARGPSGRQDQQSASEVERQDGPDRPGRPAGLGHREHPGVDQDQRQIGDAEDDAVAAEGLGHRDRGDQQGGHPGQHQESPEGGRGRDVVGEPGEAVVHPPEHDQDEPGLDDVGRPGRLPEHRGELGQREDEDQVEEQLQRRDTAALVEQRRSRTFRRLRHVSACHDGWAGPGQDARGQTERGQTSSTAAPGASRFTASMPFWAPDLFS